MFYSPIELNCIYTQFNFLHSGRKSTASLLSDADVPYDVIQMAIGHVSDDMTDTYIIPDPKKLTDALNNLYKSVPALGVIYAVYNKESRDLGTPRFGFVVKSFIGDQNGEIVKTGFDNWAAVRKAARQYAKDNFYRHAEKHGLSLA